MISDLLLASSLSFLMESKHEASNFPVPPTFFLSPSLPSVMAFLGASLHVFPDTGLEKDEPDISVAAYLEVASGSKSESARPGMVEQLQGKQPDEQLVEHGTVKTQLQWDNPKALGRESVQLQLGSMDQEELPPLPCAGWKRGRSNGGQLSYLQVW